MSDKTKGSLALLLTAAMWGSGFISQKLGNGKFYLIGDAIEGQYTANNLHFAAAIALILMVILLACMALLQRAANKRSAV